MRQKGLGHGCAVAACGGRRVALGGRRVLPHRRVRVAHAPLIIETIVEKVAILIDRRRWRGHVGHIVRLVSVVGRGEARQEAWAPHGEGVAFRSRG